LILTSIQEEGVFKQGPMNLGRKYCRRDAGKIGGLLGADCGGEGDDVIPEKDRNPV